MGQSMVFAASAFILPAGRQHHEAVVAGDIGAFLTNLAGKQVSVQAGRWFAAKMAGAGFGMRA